MLHITVKHAENVKEAILQNTLHLVRHSFEFNAIFQCKKEFDVVTWLIFFLNTIFFLVSGKDCANI